MDDSCAVCAESLEWVAYGACGHKDVCSTCVVRLRFICHDRRCCICKTTSDFIFVTKALGDYTRMISDFSAFPSEPKEGRLGSFWYHEDTQAFFDDVDHYKMIKAMCRLSCSVCDAKMLDELPNNDASRRRPRFRSIEQLKGHLFHQHRLVMCSLCLEGRKVFICEQKLYTRAQLDQHISTGDSEVDGSESERGGFMGHPMCEFCRTPFYGDNELYSHMSTEHYTCHICQRQHPGQYEYYKNYDDLEIHFRRDHFLCEDEACLAKKFIVFQSEAELKRHNTLEHGGRMSRSKRNAALQLPTSFRYRRSNEQENRRGRGRTFRRDTSETDLSLAIQASLEASNLDGRIPNATSSSGRASASGEISDVDPLISPLESLATTDSEQSSRYREALSQNSGNAPLEESSFPPLPMAPGSSQLKSQQDASVKKSMAAHLRVKNLTKPSFPRSSPAWPMARSKPVSAAVSPQLTPNTAPGLASSSGLNKLAADDGRALSSSSNPVQARPASSHDSSYSHSYSQSPAQQVWPTLNNSSGSSSSIGQSKPATENGPSLSTYSSSLMARPPMASDTYSSKNRGSSGKISYSASAPNLVHSGAFDSLATDFPPVSATQVGKLPTGSQVITNVEDIHSANKSLVERIRVALDFNQDKFSAFKDLSAEYRQGLIDGETYLVYVEQFGLSHLLVELAQLCPDTRKQKELIETYNTNMVSDSTKENRRSAFHPKDVNRSKKGKDKAVDAGNNTAKDNLADSIISTVRELQSSYKPSEEVEVLSKDGYRAAKGKSKIAVDESQGQLSSTGESAILKGQTDLSGSIQKKVEKDGRSKQRKKTSKFHRIRLGDGSAAAILDLKNPNSDQDPDPDLSEAASGGQNHFTEGVPGRGVWRDGGGQKLFTMTSRQPKK
ncbi:E3 ubiquitin-protein ligase ZNF598 [Coffea eugenioides]|uniref:E3 ubiquitin-protein ligase ZNF598 n=1 Tax=Coffea eugenioides TaxID=49369 RepID=UPI000F608A51|nr:E3 ubiquitin-protein ligase ZNF598 [Coffea eugenioides]